MGLMAQSAARKRSASARGVAGVVKRFDAAKAGAGSSRLGARRLPPLLLHRGPWLPGAACGSAGAVHGREARLPAGRLSFPRPDALAGEPAVWQARMFAIRGVSGHWD